MATQPRCAGPARACTPRIGPRPFSRATVSPVSSTFRPVPPLQLAPSHVSSLSLGLVGGFSSILRVSSRLADSGRSFGARVCVGVESCSAKPCAPPGRAPRSLETGFSADLSRWSHSEAKGCFGSRFNAVSRAPTPTSGLSSEQKSGHSNLWREHSSRGGEEARSLLAQGSVGFMSYRRMLNHLSYISRLEYVC